MNTNVSIFSVQIDNISAGEALHRAGDWLHSHEARMIITPNPEILLEARRNPQYAAALNKADLSIPDGYGLQLVRAVNHTVPGVDFATDVLQLASNKRMNVMCVVRKDGRSSLQQVVDSVRHLAPHATVSGVAVNKNEWQDEAVLKAIEEYAPQIVLVGLGFPQQELWLAQYLHRLPSVSIGIAVGGTFDFWTGVAKRAPRVLRTLRLEWLWRVIQQPTRIGRILKAVVIFPIMYFIFNKKKS